MRPNTHDLLTREATDWHLQGLINRSLLDVLLERYSPRGQFSTRLLKWLGVFAIFQLGLAVLAFISLMANSASMAALLMGGISAALWYFGVRMATDPHRRYPFTGAVLVTASLAAAFGTFVLIYIVLRGQPEGGAIPTLMLLTSVLGVLTAYAHHLRLSLIHI